MCLIFFLNGFNAFLWFNVRSISYNAIIHRNFGLQCHHKEAVPLHQLTFVTTLSW